MVYTILAVARIRYCDQLCRGRIYQVAPLYAFQATGRDEVQRTHSLSTHVRLE